MNSFLRLLVILISLFSYSLNAQLNWSHEALSNTWVFRIIKTSNSSLLAATGAGIFRKANNSSSWTETYTNASYNVFQYKSGVIIASTAISGYTSNDDGQTWTIYYSGPGVTQNFRMHQNNNSLFAATTSNGLQRSDDGGSSWYRVAFGGMHISDVLSYNSKLIVSSNDNYAVFVSSNDGSTWTQSVTGLPSGLRGEVLKQKNGTIFLGTDAGIYKSENQGASWTYLGLSSEYISSIEFYNDFIIVGAYGSSSNPGGVFISSDGGSNWQPNNSSLPYQDVWDFYIDENNETIYLATGPNGIYKSSLQGLNESVPNQPYGVSVFSATNGSYLRVHWFDNSDNEDGFYVYRKTQSSNNYYKVATVSTNTTSWNDYNVNVNSEYCYTVSAYNNVGESNLANPRCEIVTDVFVEELDFDNKLFQNYPNPFNPQTKISFTLKSDSYVRLSVYNIIGEKIKDLFNNYTSKGYHEIVFDASNLASGIYYYRIETGNYSEIRKMSVIQ